MKTIVAKYAGKCAICGGSFVAGTKISYNGSTQGSNLFCHEGWAFEYRTAGQVAA